jgi:DNA-binding NtrC family response regulator
LLHLAGRCFHVIALIGLDDIVKQSLRKAVTTDRQRGFSFSGHSLKQMEKDLIRAAEILGISRQTLQNKLREYGP